MSELVIVRGVPGSGKTTFACKEFPNHVLIEADEYFMIGGEYCFDQQRIPDAHKWCQWRVKTALERGLDVIVANTFTRYWEMKEYLFMRPNAQVFRCVGDFGNVHGVPDAAVARMRERFEDLHGEEKVTL